MYYKILAVLLNFACGARNTLFNSSYSMHDFVLRVKKIILNELVAEEDSSGYNSEKFIQDLRN